MFVVVVVGGGVSVFVVLFHSPLLLLENSLLILLRIHASGGQLISVWPVSWFSRSTDSLAGLE